MEFPDLGENCAFSMCKQLDFLPIQCVNCKLYFCKEHNLPFHHQCTHPPRENPSHAIDTSHLPKSYPCSFQGCKGSELTPVTCKFCGTQLCLKHRQPPDHACTKQTVGKEPCSLTPKEKVAKIIGKELSSTKPSGRVGKKSSRTSSKVVEMKLKMKAKGSESVPLDERVYLDVEVIPTKCREALFFSKVHTVGRIIDGVAALLKLKNDNHIGNARKLRFLTEDGVVLPTDMSLENVLATDVYGVQPFGNVLLDYTSPS